MIRYHVAYVMKKLILLFYGLFILANTMFSDPFTDAFADDPVPPANYDESKIPEYTLPDPLVMQDGTPVETAEQWTEKRRPELLNLFAEEMFGKAVLRATGESPIRMHVKKLDSAPVFDGGGIRHQLELTLYAGESPTESDPKVGFLVYTPVPVAGSKKFPMFLGLNFQGNHTVSADPGIELRDTWSRKEKKAIPAEDADRGKASKRFPVELILERGYAIGTAYYEEWEPDFDGGIHLGVRRLLYKENEKQNPDEADAIATWAWGLGMLLNAVTQFSDKLEVDPTQVAVFGHSRLGKTSLWAGAIDERFAMVISNDSGCGGAALNRREFGETVHRINTVFPHWFCDNFRKYNKSIADLPFDQHELIALIAPRPVYIASASKDLWADPRGEFLSGLHADPVYRLLGTEGFGDVREFPGIEEPVGKVIRYHNREGEHDLLEYDWIRYLDFADEYLRK